jgi:hypothetical protein
MNRQTLIDEIKQVTLQYNVEVGRANKAWPKSVSDRVVQLLEGGMNSRRISRETGISYHTVLKWRAKKCAPRGRYSGKFKEIVLSSGSERQEVNVVAAVQNVSPPQDAPFVEIPKRERMTVGTSDGFSIEVGSLEEAVRLVCALRVAEGGSSCS